MDIKQFKYGEAGMGRFFGSLEAKIMEQLWEIEELTIKDVQQRLAKDKQLNFNTVMTVMNRLHDKGLLSKRMRGRRSAYRAVMSREAFIEGQSRQLTENLLDEFGDVVLTHMLDAIKDVDHTLLDKLELKLKQMKQDSR